MRRSFPGTDDTTRLDTCSGEFGREALGIAIGLREAHRQGNGRVDLSLVNRTLRMG